MLIMKLLFEVQCSLHQVYFKYTFLNYTLRYFLYLVYFKYPAKSREIRQKYFQRHVCKTYLILILAIRPILFTPNVQIYLETSSLQWVNNVPKLPGVFRWTLRKTGH